MQMWVLLVFLHSNCQDYSFCQGCLLPAELRRLTSWLKMPPLRRFQIEHDMTVWQHDTAAKWFQAKKKGWLLGSGETSGKHVAISDNQLDDCGCQHWTFQGPKMTSWSGFNGKFGGSRRNENRKVQGFTQKLDQKSTRQGNSMDTHMLIWCRGCAWMTFCQCWWKKTLKVDGCQ